MGPEVNSEDGGRDSCELTDQVVPSPELSPHISEAGLVLFPAAGEVKLVATREGSSLLDDSPTSPVCGLITQPGLPLILEEVGPSPAVWIFLFFLPTVGGV